MEVTREPYPIPVEPKASSLSRALSFRLELNWEFWVYVIILVLAIFTRFYVLGDRTMSHDESLHTKFSWDLYDRGIFQHTPLMHGPVLFHMTALNYFLFGDNDFTARIYPAVLGILMVMFPLLFRPWIGRWGAILACIMFLVSPLILYYNRYIREDTPSIFYTLVMVYCTFMYLNGPRHLRRKARWLYIFSGALLLSLATKETAFMYIAIFGSVLTLYWVVRLGQYFFHLPGKSLFYFLSLAVLIAAVAALGMYIVLAITPLDSPNTLTAGTLEYQSFILWTVLVVLATAFIMIVPMVWAFWRSPSRRPWLDLLILAFLVLATAIFFVIVEERSHVPAGVETPGYIAWPLYAFWGVCAVIVAALVYSWRAGWWSKLHRFPEFDILLILGGLSFPWLTPFIIKAMNPTSMMSLQEIANAVQAAIPIQFDTSIFAVQIFLSAIPVAPAFIVAIVAGMIWNNKRWWIAMAVFYGLFLFFFTTIFTNLQGIGTGLIGSLGYWLEQQEVRRGSQPQYYYLAIIMPFYEFLPVIGSTLAMFTGLTMYWRFRRNRLEASLPPAVETLAYDDESAKNELEPAAEPPDPLAPKKRRTLDPAERLSAVPFLIFASWWAVLNLIAYTLAGEKMPWLGTHMTTPMIFIAGWYFGRYFERIDVRAFFQRSWLYLLLLPVLFVAGVQLISPLVVGGVGGLEQVQIARTVQWMAGIVIGGIAIYAIVRTATRTGWGQFRVMVVVAAFGVLSLLTFRSAWMASFINYDLPTEYLVYAHGGPANKDVTEQIEELSQRVTGGMDLKFAYDFKISWPGAWYFRDFRNAVFLGENPSPRSMDDAAVVIVGEENRAVVESALEDRYFKFDYPRMWWPNQEYFNLTAQRVNTLFDLSPANSLSAAYRQAIFDIWWSRDYTAYAEALKSEAAVQGRDTSTMWDGGLVRWPVSDRMYVFVRRDIAAQVWDLGTGNGSAVVAGTIDTNQCTANWQILDANQVLQPAGSEAIAPVNTPRQIAIAPNGRLYVAEEFNHRISVFNPDGTLAFVFGSRGTGPGQLERPNGIAVGTISGNVYVADTWNYRVQVFTPEGEYITSWGQRGEYGQEARPEPFDGFWGPRAVALDNQEQVYVADTGNKRIRVYTSAGQYVRDIGSGGSGVGQLDEPSGVMIGADNLLYVADTWNRRISVFSLDGSPAMNYTNREGQMVNHFRVRGWTEDLGNRPYLSIDNGRGLIYVTDPDAGRILVYDTAGNCVGSFGQLNREGPGLNQFSSIGGVAVDGEGSVYAADAVVGRILRFAGFPLVAPAQQPAGLVPGPAEMTVELVFPDMELTVEVTPEFLIEQTPESTPAG